jgi:alcohol dehydrogenase class IV
MIVQTVTKSAFHDAFRRMGREDNFSYEARSALYDYLWDMSESCGIPMELDVIAICLQYSEVTDLQALAEDYGVAVEDIDDIGYLIPFSSGWILEENG